jgi:quercetin dioxygenase-like cupin family protein
MKVDVSHTVVDDGPSMTDFPAFMRNPADLVAASSEHAPGVSGYVFDGAEGAQMAFWTAENDAEMTEHAHDFDEWFIVIEGSCLLVLDGAERRVGAGEECFIPAGTRIAGRVVAGTRTVHAFGGKRAEREAERRDSDVRLSTTPPTHPHASIGALTDLLAGADADRIESRTPDELAAELDAAGYHEEASRLRAEAETLASGSPAKRQP